MGSSNMPGYGSKIALYPAMHSLVRVKIATQDTRYSFSLNFYIFSYMNQIIYTFLYIRILVYIFINDLNQIICKNEKDHQNPSPDSPDKSKTSKNKYKKNYEIRYKFDINIMLIKGFIKAVVRFKQINKQLQLYSIKTFRSWI